MSHTFDDEYNPREDGVHAAFFDTTRASVFYDPEELRPDPDSEFICTSCNLVAHVSGRTQTVCRDCVSTLGGSK